MVATLIGDQNSLGDAVLRLAVLINPSAPAEIAAAVAAPAAADDGAGEKNPKSGDEIYVDSGDGEYEIPANPAVDEFREAMRHGRFPKCRQSLVRRIEQTLTGSRSLTGDGTMADAKLLRRLHTGLCDEAGNFTLGSDLEEAFVERSKAYVSGKSIGAVLEGVLLPLPRIKLLMEVEEGIFGTTDRQRLGNYILAILKESENQASLLKPDSAPAVHMRKLAGTQRLILESRLSKAQKEAASAILDDICTDILDRGKIFAKIADRSSSKIDECMSILVSVPKEVDSFESFMIL